MTEEKTNQKTVPVCWVSSLSGCRDLLFGLVGVRDLLFGASFKVISGSLQGSARTFQMRLKERRRCDA